MTRFLLAIFLIIFGCKLMATHTSLYQTLAVQLTLPSEETKMEHDEQKKTKHEQDDMFYLPALYIPDLNGVVLQVSSLKYSKTLSGFTIQLFTPPDSI